MRHFTILLTILFAAMSANASVNILPMSPKQGEQITIEYTPFEGDKQWVEDSKNFHAVFFGFSQDAESPVAVEVSLKKQKQRWVGTITPSSDIVYGMVKVGNGIRYDNNKELFWSVFIHDAGGRPVNSSHLKAAMACLGMLPAECRRKQDFEEAERELVEETKVHSDNLAAQVHLLMVSQNLQLIDEQEVQVKLQQLTQGTTKPKNVMDAIALAQSYQMLGQTGDAERVMAESATAFPNSKIEEQAKLERLGKATSLPEFVNGITTHLSSYPNTFAKQNLIDAAVSTTTQRGDLKLLVEFLDNTPGLTAMTYYLAVNYIGSQDSLRPDAFRMIEKGFAATKNEKLRPSYVVPSEWAEQQRISTGLLHFVNAAILSSDKSQTEKALQEFATAIEIGGEQTDKAAYDMYIATLVSAGKNSEALKVAKHAISHGAGTQGVLTNYRMLMKNNGADSIAIEKDIASMREDGSKVLVQRLSREMLNQGMIDGTFHTVDGKPLKISDWKGKVVVLDYWATWCGPCRKSFPSMQKLYEKYRNNPNVVFAIVNVWERTPDRTKVVTDFLSSNASLTFPVYIDKDDSVVAKFGVTGIPTKFFLGKDGRIQFKEVGLLPDEQFMEEASNKIDVLLAQ